MGWTCDDCRSLIGDILNGSTHTNNRWHTIASRHATLSYRTHLNGNVDALQESKASGCQVCCVILDKIRRYNNLNSQSVYHIFVWGKVPLKCQFQIALGD